MAASSSGDHVADQCRLVNKTVIEPDPTFRGLLIIISVDDQGQWMAGRPGRRSVSRFEPSLDIGAAMPTTRQLKPLVRAEYAVGYNRIRAGGLVWGVICDRTWSALPPASPSVVAGSQFLEES